MDYLSIIFAAIGGGLGGGLGAIFSSKISNKKIKNIVIVFSVVFLAQVSGKLAKNQNIRDMILKPSRLEVFARNSSELLKNNPIFLKAVAGMTSEQIKVFTQRNAQRGLRRLSFNNLKNWNNLRIRMAEINNKICAGFWTGRIPQNELMGTFDKFNDNELKLWIKISLTAANLELNQESFINPPKTALQTGIQTIAADLKKGDIKRFDSILQTGVNANNEDACWAMIKLLKRSKSFTRQQQEYFLRSLASL